MIHGIGKAGAGRLELVRGSVERSASIDKQEGEGASHRLTGTASSAVAELAAKPPIDSDKIAAIAAAIAARRYSVDPQKIAASMLALDLPRGVE